MACEDYTLGVTDTGEPFGIRRDTPYLAMMLRGGRTGLRAELRPPILGHLPGASTATGTRRCPAWYSKGRRHSKTRSGCTCASPNMTAPLPRHWGRCGTAVSSASATGRNIEKTAPVLFRRTKLTGEMPDPATGGGYVQLEKLWEFVPVLRQGTGRWYWRGWCRR